MKPGDTVRWKPGYRLNSEPMKVYDTPADEPGFVRLDGPTGSLVSRTLLELVEEAPAGQDDGLMAVVEAQMAEIDRLVSDATAESSLMSEAIGSVRFMDPPDGGSVSHHEQVARMRRALECAEARRAGEDGGFREEVERMLGNLCVALGYDRRPLVKTGIHELDVLCRFVGDE